MIIDKDKLKALIAECRYGVSGKGPAIAVANDLLVDCCDNLESLLAEIERMTNSLVASTKVNSAVMVRANGLDAEAAELRKDAERHRWLRQYEFDIGSYHGVHEHNHAAWFEHIDDEAIDRSIAEEAKFADDNEQPDQEPQ
jgi:hypothetical protein